MPADFGFVITAILAFAGVLGALATIGKATQWVARKLDVWRHPPNPPPPAPPPIPKVTRLAQLTELRECRHYVLGNIDGLIALLIHGDLGRAHRLLVPLQGIEPPDPILIGDIGAVRAYVEAVADALERVPAGRVAQALWTVLVPLARVPFFELADGERLAIARLRVEAAFERQEKRILDGLEPIRLDRDDVKAAIDLEALLERFRQRFAVNDETSGHGEADQPGS